MSLFYLLPPRPLVAEHLASWLPGLDLQGTARRELPDLLAAVAAGQSDVHVVFREDLPDGEDPGRALADGFGAESGDEVVEVRPGLRPGELTSRRWRVPARLPLAA